MPEVELIEILDTSEKFTIDWETAIANMIKRGATVYRNSLQHGRKHFPRCNQWSHMPSLRICVYGLTLTNLFDYYWFVAGVTVACV